MVKVCVQQSAAEYQYPVAAVTAVTAVNVDMRIDLPSRRFVAHALMAFIAIIQMENSCGTQHVITADSEILN